MLETISKGFNRAKLRLQGKTILSEENIKLALKDVRQSLLSADVELNVTKGFLNRVKERAIGEVVKVKHKSKRTGPMHATPADHFIKICHDELVGIMGPVDASIQLDADPSIIMMVGLQGSGKTTTSGKLAKKLLDEGKKPMLVAADIYRPAAIDQLQVLGQRLNIPVFTIRGMDPVTLCTLAVEQAKNVGRDVVIFDTAGRLAIDNKLMNELLEIKAKTNPHNIFFVCDAMIGQSAVATAKSFDELISFTGFILTKLDGDTRGGAALSIKEVTGKPIKFLGMGEDLDDLEEFRPQGLADRILGFGDVVGLMNDFEKVTTHEDAEKDAMKMLQGNFGFDDFLKQMKMIQKMGSLRSLMERMPGMSGMLANIPKEALDDRELVKVKAIIQSMTKQERKNPDILDISRLKRVARGCGRSLEDIEAFYDRFLQARVMMTQLGQSGMLANMMKGKGGMPNMGGGGGFPNMGGGGFPNMGGGFPNMRQQKKPKRSPEEKAKRLAESRKRLKLKKKKKR
jgi:signal recognition particle subunit SRP54